ncbi:hypothetical protein IV203_031688 [Nitzschia inconspicua]|uniref:Uncharacterized protein n=1 Tax=Nitzschia inconspicua TaxID=303405 RepID=A0A9K3LUT1_9STRA|nr:hypothetical protein IV203_031688 [Nitzschia inconspicua]
MNCSNLHPGSEFNFCEKVGMESGNPFQAFLERQFEKCLPMEVLTRETESLPDITGNVSARSRTKNSTAVGNGSESLQVDD